MTDKHAKIDELIEESYLAMLSEDRIRRDLLQFLETCHQCVAESALDQRLKSYFSSQIEDFRGLALRVDSAEEIPDEEDEWATLTPRDRLAHRAARVKMMVLSVIREKAPGFADELERKRFPSLHAARGVHRQPLPVERPGNEETRGIRYTLAQTLYALLAGVTAFLIIYRVFFN